MSEVDISTVTAASAGQLPGYQVQSTDFTFHDVLSACNPLQYLPVVGTIYRALTGDIVPEPLRVAGSLLVGGLTGGPLGVLISAASSGLQKLAGLDLDQIAHRAFAALGVVDDAAPATAATNRAVAQTAAPVPAALEAALPSYDAALRRAAGAAYARAEGLA